MGDCYREQPGHPLVGDAVCLPERPAPPGGDGHPAAPTVGRITLALYQVGPLMAHPRVALRAPRQKSDRVDGRVCVKRLAVR